MSTRNQWFVKNLTQRQITISDLNKLPTVGPEKSLDSLKFHTKEEVAQSANLKSLIRQGWVRVVKIEDGTHTTVTSDNLDELTVGGGGGAGVANPLTGALDAAEYDIYDVNQLNCTLLTANAISLSEVAEIDMNRGAITDCTGLEFIDPEEETIKWGMNNENGIYMGGLDIDMQGGNLIGGNIVNDDDNVLIDLTNKRLFGGGGGGDVSLNWSTRRTSASDGTTSLDWEARTLKVVNPDDFQSTTVLDWSGISPIVNLPTSTQASRLGNGQWTVDVDQVGNSLKFRVKYDNGTTKTGSVSLS